MPAQIPPNTRFGRLIVQELSYTKNSKNYYNCLCDCGAYKTICASNLLSGSTISCGCYRKQVRKLYSKQEYKRRFL